MIEQSIQTVQACLPLLQILLCANQYQRMHREKESHAEDDDKRWWSEMMLLCPSLSIGGVHRRFHLLCRRDVESGAIVRPATSPRHILLRPATAGHTLHLCLSGLFFCSIFLAESFSIFTLRARQLQLESQIHYLIPKQGKETPREESLLKSVNERQTTKANHYIPCDSIFLSTPEI